MEINKIQKLKNRKKYKITNIYYLFIYSRIPNSLQLDDNNSLQLDDNNLKNFDEEGY